MSVTDVNLTWTGQTGGTDDSGDTRYGATYMVNVDSASDGAQVILAAAGSVAFTDELPEIGDTYAFGNDADADTFCNSLAPKRRNKTRLIWDVTVGWGVPGNTTSGTDSSGNPTTNPLEFRDDISIEFAKVSEPVRKATLQTAGLGGVFGEQRFVEPGEPPVVWPGKAPGDELPVMNAAGEILDPPLEQDFTQMIFRRTTSRTSFPMEEAVEYSGAINSDTFVITIPPDGATYTAKPFTALADNFGGTLNFTNGVLYWRFRYELIVDRKGWREDLPNQGFQQWADVGVWTGEVDGAGDKILYTATDFPTGGLGPMRKTIRDLDGGQLQKPALLDTNGLLQIPGAETLFIKWSKRDELPFTGQALFT